MARQTHPPKDAASMAAARAKPVRSCERKRVADPPLAHARSYTDQAGTSSVASDSSEWIALPRQARGRTNLRPAPGGCIGRFSQNGSLRPARSARASLSLLQATPPL